MTQKLVKLKKNSLIIIMINILQLPQFNTLAADVFNARLAQANLITKTDFDAKLSSLNRKITSNKSKHLLVENELKKLKTFDSSYFRGKSHFEEDGTQNYLVFQPINRYFKVIANKLYISSWKSKGLSNETIKPPATSDNSLTPLIDYRINKIRVKFTGSCLKQPKISYTHGTIVNIYIVYELGASGSNDNDPTLKRWHIEWHETCKCKCRLDGSVCNNKQRWNDDKCSCKFKELIDKGVWNKGYIWNPSNCECECNRSYDVGEYLDYKNCKCRKKLADKLHEECTWKHWRSKNCWA